VRVALIERGEPHAGERRYRSIGRPAGETEAKACRPYFAVTLQHPVAIPARSPSTHTAFATTHYWMDAVRARRNTCAMARYHHNVYANSETPRYLVIFDLQWKIIDCQRLEASTDLRSAMTAAIDRLTAEGWQSEGSPDFGFMFLNRDGIRRLLILTARDPADTRPQSFSPWMSF
jgi:hypothetical protein